MELAMVEEKRIFCHKSENQKKIFFIGFAEFDDLEGPIISYIYPESFPLDINENYRIADYALYIQSRAQFETEKFVIYVYPFKIYDSKYERKVRYYSIVLGYPKKHKMKFASIVEIVDYLMDSSISKLKSNKMLNSNVVREVLSQLYYTIKSKFCELYRRDSSDSSVLFHKRENEGANDAKNFFIIDTSLGIIINYSKELIDSFYKDPSKFFVKYYSELNLIIVTRNPEKINDNLNKFININYPLGISKTFS